MQCISQKSRWRTLWQEFYIAGGLCSLFSTRMASEPFTMQKADFRFPDTQRTGSNGCLKWFSWVCPSSRQAHSLLARTRNLITAWNAQLSLFFNHGRGEKREKVLFPDECYLSRSKIKGKELGLGEPECVLTSSTGYNCTLLKPMGGFWLW